MTTIKKTSTAVDAEETPSAPAEPIKVIGLPLREGQVAEQVTFAHHLRIGATEVKPGDRAHVSPDYARQLRRSGYIARARG
ncbi:hypothetical protein ACFYZ9_33395 [Streptomyces sp. NPDC001691]|uniref:hypothetical protein n=1 Tax=Streptomyces sp. NPDC001691 TaxID=3364600 RepID=UPI0036C32BA9